MLLRGLTKAVAAGARLLSKRAAGAIRS